MGNSIVDTNKWSFKYYVRRCLESTLTHAIKNKQSSYSPPLYLRKDLTLTTAVERLTNNN